MNDQNVSNLKNVCREVFDAFQEELSWKWDSRLETVLAEFGVDNKDMVHEILERHLSITWDISNIDTAPETVQMISSYLGGLWPGQLLFTSDPNRDAFLFCAWWPWGNGTTISIRIAPSFKDGVNTAKAEQIKLFKSWFGV